MSSNITEPEQDIRRLHRCISDLGQVLDLPAVLYGGEPEQILHTLLDALLKLTDLDFAYARVRLASKTSPLEILKIANSDQAVHNEIRQALHPWLEEDFAVDYPNAKTLIADQETSVLPFRLGVEGSLGVILVGCKRLDFPKRTERLVINVAANQASLMLQAQLLNEKERASRDLDERIAKKTRELAAANERLKNMESDASLIVDSIPGLIAVMSSTGEIETVNRQLLEYFGQTLEELKGWGTNDTVHPDDLPHVIAVFSRSIADGTPYEILQRFKRSDGVYRWFQNKGFPLRDKNHNIVRWCVLLSDIDDQKRAEAALRESEAFLLDAQQLSHTGSWKHDFISGVVSGTPEIDRIFAITPQDNRASVDFFFNRIHPEDRASESLVYERALTDKRDFESDYRIVLPNGSIKYIHNTGRPKLNKAGEVIGFLGTAIDLTEQHKILADLGTALIEIKRSEAALRESENHLRLIVDTIPGLVCTLKANWEVERVNQPTRDYFGMTLEELKGWEFIGVVHPDDLEQVVAMCRRSSETGEPYEIEHRCKRSDGVYRWFQVRAMPFRDELGQIARWYLLLTDIEDRKRAEEAVLASEENLRLIINTMPVLAWSARPDGSVDFFNQRWLDYTGLSSTEAQEWGWAQSFHPDDMDRVTVYWRSIMSTGDSGQIEARLRRFDSTYRWFFIRADPLRDESGVITRWYGTNTDIEDRKRAEEELHRKEAFLTKAQRLSGTGSFSWCLDTDEITFSEETYRIFGFEPDAVITFELMATRIHPEDLPIMKERSEAARKSGEGHDYEIRLIMPDGSLKYLHTNSNEARDLNGRREYIGAIQDVTQRRVAQESLSQARSELAHISRITSLSELTASMAHEINQPLSGILTNANTLLRMLNADTPNVEGARETAKRTIRDGKRASDVITRLRTLFSKKEFVAEHVDLNEATREVIALSVSELQRNGTILQYDFADRLPVVSCDRVQIQQVILNLLRNASDAMRGVEDRPRRLLIRTEQVDENVCVAVQDSGIGFEPAIADRLFESFYTTKSEGMGIGLSVSRSIIEAHRGRLWARANEGPGAIFAFSIPCHAPLIVDNEPPGATKVKAFRSADHLPN